MNSLLVRIIPQSACVLLAQQWLRMRRRGFAREPLNTATSSFRAARVLRTLTVSRWTTSRNWIYFLAASRYMSLFLESQFTQIFLVLLKGIDASRRDGLLHRVRSHTTKKLAENPQTSFWCGLMVDLRYCSVRCIGWTNQGSVLCIITPTFGLEPVSHTRTKTAGITGCRHHSLAWLWKIPPV